MQLLFINIEFSSYQSRRILETAPKLGFEIIPILFRDLSLHIKPIHTMLLHQGQPLDLKNTSVITRNVKHGLNYQDLKLHNYIIQHLVDQSCPTLNAQCILNFPELEDKLQQSLLLSKNNFPIIPTYFINNINQTSLIPTDQYPLIKKPRFGSHGTGIENIANPSILHSTISMEPPHELIFQPFIPNDHDLRVMATPNNIIGAMKRARTTGVVNNFSAGGQISNYDLTDPQLTKLCTQLCQTLNADYLGIDLIPNSNTGNYSILEINRYCQFEGFEKATGIDFAQTLLTLLKNKIS